MIVVSTMTQSMNKGEKRVFLLSCLRWFKWLSWLRGDERGKCFCSEASGIVLGGSGDDGV
jgi:hypothetical protein